MLAMIRFGVSVILLLIVLGQVLGSFQIDVFVVVLGIFIYFVWFGSSLMRHVATFEFAGVKITTKDLRRIKEQAVEHGILSTESAESFPEFRLKEPVDCAREADLNLRAGDASGKESAKDSLDPTQERERPRLVSADADIPLFIQLDDSPSAVRLMLLRRDIEKELYKLAENADIRNTRYGVTHLAQSLAENNILSAFETTIILELTKILNMVVHGASVEEGAAEQAIDIGAGILLILRQRGARGSEK